MKILIELERISWIFDWIITTDSNWFHAMLLIKMFIKKHSKKFAFDWLIGNKHLKTLGLSDRKFP